MRRLTSLCVAMLSLEAVDVLAKAFDTKDVRVKELLRGENIIAACP